MPASDESPGVGYSLMREGYYQHGVNFETWDGDQPGEFMLLSLRTSVYFCADFRPGFQFFMIMTIQTILVILYQLDFDDGR